MLAGAAVSGLVCLGLARLLRPRMGTVAALSIAGLVWSLVVIGLINLIHVGNFGEVEFWLSLIKVLAIVAMIFGGVILMFLPTCRFRAARKW